MTSAKRSVTVLGAGLMGSAVVRALCRAGHPVRVWNRTRSRAEPLADAGATIHDTVESALSSSDVVISMLLTHEAAMAALAGPATAGTLRGSVLVNLTTSMPQQVPAIAELAREGGAGFLDGIIPVYPDAVGRRGASLLYAGDESVWDDVAPVLLALGGRSRWVGDDVRVAAVIDATSIGHLALTMEVAIVESLAYARSFGVGARQLQPFLAEIAGAAPALLDDLVERIEGQTWGTERATLDTLKFSMELFRDSGRQAGLRDGTVAAAAELMASACEAGLGDADMVALHQHLLGEPAPLDG